MTRAIVLVLDSLGLGAAPDVVDALDAGANTLGHIAAWRHAQGRPLQIPHLLAMGLAHAAQQASGQWLAGVPVPHYPLGAFGAARPVSKGKDTPSGHWELMGCPVPFDWGYFAAQADSRKSVFPADVMERWYAECGLPGSLGNCHASGTEIIARLGNQHVQTGMPICYTSSDSVFQVAAHETHFGLERLLDICKKAKHLFDAHNIARVIARPFLGADGRYQRTANRHDFTTPPVAPTLLDGLVAAGREVSAVGKISDIFAARGITESRHGDGNAQLCQQTLCAWSACAQGGMVFANLVDFDMLYGHRRDVAGYADAIEAFDAWLPTLLHALRPGDLLAITADHGCDPTWPGSDHTREYVPLLFGGPAAPQGLDVGIRASFADLGQTLATHLGVSRLPHGAACWRPAEGPAGRI